MTREMLRFLLLAGVFPWPSPAGDQPVIVVHAFTTAAGTTWPYDMKQMQTELVAELQAKFGKRFDVVTEPLPASHGKVYAGQ